MINSPIYVPPTWFCPASLYRIVCKLLEKYVGVYFIIVVLISTDFKWCGFSFTEINVLYDENDIKVTIVIPTGNSELVQKSQHNFSYQEYRVSQKKRNKNDFSYSIYTPYSKWKIFVYNNVLGSWLHDDNSFVSFVFRMTEH